MADSHPCRPPRRKRVKDWAPKVVIEWAEKNKSRPPTQSVISQNSYMYQNVNRPAICMVRAVAVVSCPKVLELTVLTGLPKLVWFSVLKVSIRS